MLYPEVHALTHDRLLVDVLRKFWIRNLVGMRHYDQAVRCLPYRSATLRLLKDKFTRIWPKVPLPTTPYARNVNAISAASCVIEKAVISMPWLYLQPG